MLRSTTAPLHSESFAWWALRSAFLRPQGLLGVRRRCDGSLPNLDVVGYQNMPALKGQAGALQVRGARRSGREGYLEAMLTGQCKPVNVRSEHRSAYVYTAPAAPRSAPALLKKRRTSRGGSKGRHQPGGS